MDKTNAMRMLEKHGVQYIAHEYDAELTDGVSVAAAVNIDKDRVFKTLVTFAPTRRYYVFMIPVGETLDLKKAARSVGEKSIEMLKQKDLLSLTGYVHGGCSPIGMKKQFAVTIDETAQLYDSIAFSGGKRGLQVEVNTSKFNEKFGFAYCDLTMR